MTRTPGHVTLEAAASEASPGPSPVLFGGGTGAERQGEGARVDGARRYHAVGVALADAPRDPALTYVVYVRAGRYHEKLSVDRPHVTLLGEDRDRTVITFDAASDTPERRRATCFRGTGLAARCRPSPAAHGGWPNPSSAVEV